MKLTYRISNAALWDLDQIWIYTAENWSTTQADKYYREIITAIDKVIRDFDKGLPAIKIRAGYRSSIINSHVIFYKMGNDSIIEIVRILHKAMDWERHLK